MSDSTKFVLPGEDLGLIGEYRQFLLSRCHPCWDIFTLVEHSSFEALLHFSGRYQGVDFFLLGTFTKTENGQIGKDSFGSFESFLGAVELFFVNE